jgi:transcriptional regulator with XRE-family HTH domain
MGLHQDVGRAIRRCRESSGLSQAALAEATGRSIQMIGMIERGMRSPSFETLEAIAGVLGVRVREFFPDATQVNDDLISRVIGLLAPLSERERAWVYRVLLAMLTERRP